MVSDATTEDLPEIQRLHSEMGLDYRLPDLDSPLFLIKKVFKNGEGKIIGSCLLRLQAEAYLMLDPALDPVEKMDVIEELQEQGLQDAYNLGIDDVEARIPVETEMIFQKRLRQLGWVKDRDGWMPWSRSTHALSTGPSK